MPEGAKIVADGGEHGIVLIAVAATQEVPAQIAILFQVADHGFDGSAGRCHVVCIYTR